MYTVVASKKKSPTAIVSVRIPARTRRDLLRLSKLFKHRNLSETAALAIHNYVAMQSRCGWLEKKEKAK